MTQLGFMGRSIVVLACVAALGDVALGWQNVCEDDFGGDAQSQPEGAHVVAGGGGIGGSVEMISGRLNGGTGPGVLDLEDMYRIYIADPSVFSMQISSPGFDGQLWLFQGPGGQCQIEGGGLLANDGFLEDCAAIADESNESPSFRVNDRGLYYIAVTSRALGGGRIPLSQSGEIYFFDGETVSRADGAGGADRINGWSGGSGGGLLDYDIELDGVNFGCLGDVDLNDLVDFQDLVLVLARWDPMPCDLCPEDFDGDGVVLFPDLLTVLANWGPCPSACCLPDDTCIAVRAQDCVDLGGSPLGVGTYCSPFPCPGATGACCLPQGGQCQIEPLANCEAIGGLFQGVGSTCAPDPCANLAGGCCFPFASCQEQTLGDCTAAGGSWLGPASPCCPNSCPGEITACCLPNDSCIDLTLQDCNDAGGVSLGSGTACGTDPCLDNSGACCLPGGTCVTLDSDACAAAFGAWNGQNVQCGNDPCPAIVLGACCIDIMCLDTTELHCAFLAGEYQGDCTTCATTFCGGACCFPTGVCNELTEADCIGMGGNFQGGGTICAPNPCVGACCGITGTCQIETEIDCIALEGFYQGNGTTCDPGTCLGACCLPGDICSVENLFVCILSAGGDGRWAGFGTDCGADPCLLVTGGCCGLGGMCGEYTEVACATVQGQYYGDGVPCLFDCTGACCLFGSCFADTSQSNCDNMGGVYQGDGTLCIPDPCATPMPDECATGQFIACNEFAVVDTGSFTTNPGDPNFSCRFGGPGQGFGTAWFTFVATDTSAFISLSNSAPIDTMVAVYSANQFNLCDFLVEIACDDDSGTGLLSEVCVSGLIPGDTYVIQTGGLNPVDVGLIEVDVICPCP